MFDETLAFDGPPPVWPPTTDLQLMASFMDANANEVVVDGYEFFPDADLVEMHLFVSGIPPQFVDGVNGQIDDGDSITLTRSIYDPEVWTYELLGRIDGDAEHSIRVHVESSRLSGGSAEQTWSVAAVKSKDVAPTEMIPSLQLALSDKQTSVMRSDLDNESLVQVTARVDTDVIPDSWRIVALRKWRDAGT